MDTPIAEYPTADYAGRSTDRKYSITVSDHQVDVLLVALDTLSRLLTGQLTIVGDTLAHSETKFPLDLSPEGRSCANNHGASDELRHCIETGFRELQKHIMGRAHTSGYGIQQDQVDERARAAYDMYQALRYKASWARAGATPGIDRRPSILVAFDEPMRTCRDRTRYPDVTVSLV